MTINPINNPINTSILRNWIRVFFPTIQNSSRLYSGCVDLCVKYNNNNILLGILLHLDWIWEHKGCSISMYDIILTSWNFVFLSILRCKENSEWYGLIIMSEILYNYSKLESLSHFLNIFFFKKNFLKKLF